MHGPILLSLILFIPILLGATTYPCYAIVWIMRVTFKTDVKTLVEFAFYFGSVSDEVTVD